MVIGRPYSQDYSFPSNVDFENMVPENEMIIISVDGKIEGMPDGCGVYFSSHTTSWSGIIIIFKIYTKADRCC